MGNKFVVRSKKSDNYVITSLRIEKGLLDAFDELAGKSDYSRNELMCMALRFVWGRCTWVKVRCTVRCSTALSSWGIRDSAMRLRRAHGR